MRGLSVRWRSGDQWAVSTAPLAVAQAFDVPVQTTGVAEEPPTRRPFSPWYLQRCVMPSPILDASWAIFRITSPDRQSSARCAQAGPDAGCAAGQYDAVRLRQRDSPVRAPPSCSSSSTVTSRATSTTSRSFLGCRVRTRSRRRAAGSAARRDGDGSSSRTRRCPDARLVVVNARPTVEGDGTYEKIGRLFESVDRDFPGAVWSLSIGWGCEALLTAADLAPARSALARAHDKVRRHSTPAAIPEDWNAKGDRTGRPHLDRTTSVSMPSRRCRR